MMSAKFLLYQVEKWEQGPNGGEDFGNKQDWWMIP